MIVVVTGPTTSGKSMVAERIAASSTAPVTYVATADVTDDDMAARVDAHRDRRPADWTTVEAGATAVIQPGGSVRDDEVIAAADEAGIAMMFTGMRHFRH